jgi:esterase/lipase superfamily enzyme
VDRARRRKRHVLFFVHGYNNDVAAVLERAGSLERRFPVEVVAFTWPANGGGARGALSYLSDKRDARASAGALERTIVKMQDYLRSLTEAERSTCWAQAERKHPANVEMRDALYARLMERRCPFTVNMMAHSMGNYVLKQAVKSSLSEATRLLFDNIALVAADTNLEGHAAWVDRLHCRGRIYVCINERDGALAASRMKSGEEQLARLGHSLYGLDSRSATYVDFTDASYVATSHAYFEGNATDRNEDVKRFFSAAFSGERATDRLRFNAARNTYEFR